MAIDQKVNKIFNGKVVRKDLVRKVKVGANVPLYVLEYLLGKYCATDDPLAIQAGLILLDEVISRQVINPEESDKIQARLKENEEYTLIDKVRVRLIASEDKYWAELTNLGQSYIHIPIRYIRKYERLFEGGVWCEVKLQYMYDEEQRGRKSPFWIKELKPIQLASFDFEEYQSKRKDFSRDEWIDLLITSIGLEPGAFSKRQKMLFVIRLIPLVENNYNLIELGPRGTGKSYIFREISPFSILISGGKTTVPNLFYNMGTHKVGLVGLWDTVAFDEVAGMDLHERDVIDILKDYMEAGSFSRGREEITARASMCFLGNINQPVDVLTKTGNLFQPLPDKMADPALIDRFHYYLPGWELPKMAKKLFTNNYGFVVDYLAEAFRESRKLNYTEKADDYFHFGDHLNARDVKAVRKTVSGLIKLIHPDGEVTKDEIYEYLQLAMEGRRRVKEQLKKMLSFEYSHTRFSFIDQDTQEEIIVGVPEEGGRDLISPDPLSAGSVYSVYVDSSGVPGLFRIEVGTAAGTGKVRQSGGMRKLMKESLGRAFSYLKSHKVEFGVGREVDMTDFNVECVNLLGSGVDAPMGVAFFVALFSALKNRPIKAATIVLGDMTIQGNIKPLPSIQEALQLGMDNGARRACIPIENKRHFLDVPGDIVEKVDPIFYGDPIAVAGKLISRE